MFKRLLVLLITENVSIILSPLENDTTTLFWNVKGPFEQAIFNAILLANFAVSNCLGKLRAILAETSQRFISDLIVILLLLQRKACDASTTRPRSLRDPSIHPLNKTTLHSLCSLLINIVVEWSRDDQITPRITSSLQGRSEIDAKLGSKGV